MELMQLEMFVAVVEEGSELTPGRVLPADVADYVRGLHTSH